jgi:hypothetical protein
MASGPESYDTGGIDRPSRSPMIVPVEFSGQERLDLVVFMQTLTGVAEGEPAPKLPVCHPARSPMMPLWVPPSRSGSTKNVVRREPTSTTPSPKLVRLAMALADCVVA